MPIKYPVKIVGGPRFVTLMDAQGRMFAGGLEREDAEEIVSALNTQPSPSGYEYAITVEWDKHNARRHELIEAKRSRSLSEDEIAEFRELQWLAGVKRELGSGPPPDMTQPRKKSRKVQIEEQLKRSDLTAQLSGRDDIEYGHHESLPRGEHVARLRKAE